MTARNGAPGTRPGAPTQTSTGDPARALSAPSTPSRVAGTPDTVRRFIAATWDTRGEPPVYASPRWQQLAPTDPLWLAAIMRAAEAWRLDGTTAAIAAQLDDADRDVARRIRQASWDVAGQPGDSLWPVIAARAGRRARALAARGEQR